MTPASTKIVINLEMLGNQNDGNLRNVRNDTDSHRIEIHNELKINFCPMPWPARKWPLIVHRDKWYHSCHSYDSRYSDSLVKGNRRSSEFKGRRNQCTKGFIRLHLIYATEKIKKYLNILLLLKWIHCIHF